MAGKTLIHKGKLLHKHSSGFYIDLQAAVGFAEGLTARIDKRAEDFQLYIKDQGGKYPYGESHKMLVFRSNKMLVECDIDKEYPFKYVYAEGGHWVVDVEISFNEHGFGSDRITVEIFKNWQSLLNKRVAYCLPWCKSLIGEWPLASEWFPMSACYSPARIALENMQ